MEYVTLELNLNSAKDIKNLNLFSKMDVYAVVSLSGDPENPQKVKTPVDREGGTNPTWNFPVEFTVNQTLARQNRLTLEIHIRCDRALAAHKDVGNVHVPLAELLNQTGDGRSFQHVTYQVRRPSGKPKGALNFSYKFGDDVAHPAEKAPPYAAEHKAKPVPAYPPPADNKAEPVMAYPPPAAGSSSKPYAAGAAAYPPPPQQQQYGAGYGYPPPEAAAYGGYPQGQAAYGYPPAQAGYGYPPQQAGYGYPPAQGGYGYPAGQGQKPGKKSKFGLGLGAGLLGGAVGGLLIGDMVSDIGAYDAGFDGGFDGGFGFDF